MSAQREGLGVDGATTRITGVRACFASFTTSSTVRLNVTDCAEMSASSPSTSAPLVPLVAHGAAQPCRRHEAYRRHRRGLAGLLLLGPLLFGCGRDVALSGSISEVFPLTVSRVEIRRNAEALDIAYYNNRGVELDLVARVTVALEGLELQNGRKIPLEGDTPSGVARTAVVHIAGGEPARTLPRVKKGDIVLSSGSNPDETVRGTFSMLFEDNGGFGSGRTMEGSFAGQAQDAGFGDF